MDIESVLKELDPQDAELLSLVYYDGMRVTQIAKLRGVPAATVYTRLNRAKSNLKSQLKIHGIDKAIYSGNFVTMVATAIRNIIGTSLLSVAIAQRILESIVKNKGKKEIAVARVIKAQQKKTVLKIASCIVAISMLTSALTALTLIDWSRFKLSGDENYLTETSYETTTEYQYNSEVEGGVLSSQNNSSLLNDLIGGSSCSKNSRHTSSLESDISSQQSKPSNSSVNSQNTASKTQKFF